MQEEWRDIVIEKNGVVYDYTGLYQVSNLGRVRSLRRDMVLKPKLNRDKYEVVCLNRKGNQSHFFVHRLVATMFLDNPDNLPEVNHISKVRNENHIGNLEWCDRQYNVQYSSCKRSDDWKKQQSDRMSKYFLNNKHHKSKKVLCVETGEVFNTVKEAEMWLGRRGISDCARGRQNTCGNYRWQYVD